MSLVKKNPVPAQRPETALSAEPTRDLPVLVPPTDIYEGEERILVYSDMPGVQPKDLDVTLENDVLTLSGTAAVPDAPEGEWVHRGFHPGVFRRTFVLTADVNREGIVARLSQGVLEVELPKSAAAQPKKIPVHTDA